MDGKGSRLGTAKMRSEKANVKIRVRGLSEVEKLYSPIPPHFVYLQSSLFLLDLSQQL